MLISRINDISPFVIQDSGSSTSNSEIANSFVPVQSNSQNAHFKNDNLNVISPKEQLAINTLKLFCTLLDYYNEQIFLNLIGRNLTKEMDNVIENAERVKLEK
jgi:hypothetical protein